MIIIGITGSIGMGKSTVANLFKELNKNIKIFSDDKVNAELLFNNQRIKKKIKKCFPNVIIDNEKIKESLRKEVFSNKEKLKLLGSIMHPEIEKVRRWFLIKNFFFNPKSIIIFDTPLLIENHINEKCDYVVVVYSSLKTQKERVLNRNKISEEEFDFILKNQLNIKDKIKKANFTINTDKKLEETKEEIKKILEEILKNGR